MKAAALLLAGSMALAACASDEPTGESDETGAAGGEATDSGEPLQIGLAYDVGGRGDRSFNDSAYAGASGAVDALGGELQELSPNDDASNRAELLTQLAEQGYDPVIAVGFAYGDTIAEVAADFPDTTFAIVDSSVAEQYPDTNFAIVDSSVAEIGADNLTGLLFAEEQGSFLAGAASVAARAGFVAGTGRQGQAAGQQQRRGLRHPRSAQDDLLSGGTGPQTLRRAVPSD